MKKTNKNKNWSLIFTFFLSLIISVFVGYKLFAIQSDDNVISTHSPIMRIIEAPRGNILAEDGRIMSVTMPVYDIRLDLYTINQKLFDNKISSLSEKLSNLFKDTIDYKSKLIKNKDKRYFLLKRNVSYVQLQELSNFPIFRLGKNKGGFIPEMKSQRDYPFGSLCKVTIGRVKVHNDSIIPKNGIELAFNNYLEGTPGREMLQEISGNLLVPKASDQNILPKPGFDVVTSINIDFQDAAESALRKKLEQTKAAWGSVILMEVSTGKIKAMANLHLDTASMKYFDSFNHSIMSAVAPGSTFKLASLISILEDGYRDITDFVETGNTKKFIFIKDNQETKEDNEEYAIEDVKAHGKITLGQAFVVSSNIGISKVINSCYKSNAYPFISNLEKMGLTKPLELQLSYSSRLLIKTPDSVNCDPPENDWWGSTLPAMSIGYEMRLSPLHILTFYNAFANKGRMVAPQIVTDIKNNKNEIIESFPIKIISESICSQETIDKILPYMEEVVSNKKEDKNDKINGTARSIYTDEYSIAGKTGTCEVRFKDRDKQTRFEKAYSSSFVGFFPAKNSKYSCIVLLYDFKDTTDVNHYGGGIAAPVFKEISDKVFALDTSLSYEYIKNTSTQLIDSLYLAEETEELIYKISKFRRLLANGKLQNFEDLKGVELMDALYLLENAGYEVKFKGVGKVSNLRILDAKRKIIELELS